MFIFFRTESKGTEQFLYLRISPNHSVNTLDFSLNGDTVVLGPGWYIKETKLMKESGTPPWFYNGRL
ncbi:hypothetical protein AYI68_g6867, partial [Smittium mucronatum]